MIRRDFLKMLAAALAPLPAIPVKAFVPPRHPFVTMGLPGLMGLVSQLGVTPNTQELSICEGRILEIEDWDGTGYPCLVQNACSFGPNPPRVLLYDFDLWNFRHDDYLGRWWEHPSAKGFNNHASFYASRRFGEHTSKVVKQGGGWLAREFCKANKGGQP